MAALPENDRIAGPFIATGGQTDFPADFPVIREEGVRVRRRRGEATVVLSGDDLSVLNRTGEGFTVRLVEACQAGDQVWVYSRLPRARMRSHSPAGAIRTMTLEDDAMELQAQLQEIARDLAEGGGGGGGVDPEVLAEVVAEAVGPATANKVDRVQYPLIGDLLAAAGDGVTDCAATLMRTDVAFITLPPGDFRVKTNCTVQRPIYFAPGSRMTIDADVQVTFTGKGGVASDARRQVFYGPGRVRGLPFVDISWFAGDKIYFLDSAQVIYQDDIPSASLGPDATADLQSAFNAAKFNGAVRLQEGCLTLAGTTIITLPLNVSVKGDKQSSIFVFSGDVCNGFRIAYERSSFKGFWLRKANLNALATSGVALDVKGGGSHFADFFMNGAYIAVNSVNSSGGTFENFTIHNAREAGIVISNNNDPIIQNGFIVSDDEFLTLSSLAGGFAPTAGATLTGMTSGCKMVFKRTGSGNYIVTRYYGVANKPVIGETLTASTGGTAVLATYTMHHNAGGLRVVQTAEAGVSAPMTEAIMLHHVDIIGGRFSMVVEGVGTGLRQGPSYNRVTNIWLDSALDAALVMSKTDGWTFTGVCIQSRFDGLAAIDTRNTRFIGSDFRHCSAAAIMLRPKCVIDFAACTIADNRYGVAGNAGSHVYIENDPFTRVTFSGGSITRSTRDGGGIVTDYGIDLIGTGGQLFLWGVRFGPPGVDLRVGAVRNLSSLAVYAVDGCTGLLLKNKAAFVIGAGAHTSDPIPHGVHKALVPEDFRLTTSYPGGLGGLCAAVEQDNITPTHFYVTLSNTSGVLTPAPRALSINWEIDVSYRV